MPGILDRERVADARRHRRPRLELHPFASGGSLLPRRDANWVAGTLLTIVLLLLVSWSAQHRRLHAPAVAPERPRDERVTFVETDPALTPEIVVPPVAREIPLPAPPDLRARPGAPGRAAPVPLPPSRVGEVAGDSVPLLRGRPRSLIPSPEALRDTTPALAPRRCIGPCLAEQRAAAQAGERPLTRAERDSVLRDINLAVAREAAQRPSGATPYELDRRAAAQAAREMEGAGAPSRELQGVSIPVGLPGGGPSAAERRRNRELQADYEARLARIQRDAERLCRDRQAIAADTIVRRVCAERAAAAARRGANEERTGRP